MEGDLLGIDFGQTGSHQTPQGLQSNTIPGVLQLKAPLFGGLPSSAVLPQSPVQLAPAPFMAPQSPVQLTPAPFIAPQSPIQLAPALFMAPQSPVQLSPPPFMAPQSPIQLAPPPFVAQQSPVQQPSAPFVAQQSPSATAVQLSPAQHASSVEQTPSTTQQDQAQAVESEKRVQFLQHAGQPVQQASTQASVVIGPQYGANVHKIVQAIWKPSPTQDEPKDPVLREIKERFAGHWKLARSDPYDEYLRAAGVGIFARKLSIAGPLEQHIYVKGSSIHIDFHSTFSNQINVFRLEESVENLVEKTMQSVFCSYKDGKLTLLMTPMQPGMNRTQEVQRYINEHGELVTIYTCGTATCRRYFFRIADFVSPLNIVG